MSRKNIPANKNGEPTEQENAALQKPPATNPAFDVMHERGFVKKPEIVSVDEIDSDVDSSDIDEDKEVIYMTSDAANQPSLANPAMQLAMCQAPQEQLKQFQERITGVRRDASEDDSGMAFGDAYAQRLGSTGTTTMPSAPPMTAEVEEEFYRWMHANTIARKTQFEHHKQFKDFFENSGQDARQYDPYLSAATLARDDRSAQLKQQLIDLASGSEQDNPALLSLLGLLSPTKNYAQVGDIYVPADILATYADDREAAIQALHENPQYDQVQVMVNESTGDMTATRFDLFSEKVASGTLEVRMTAEGDRMVVLGEGYKKKNFVSSEGWTKIDEKIPKDTEYHHVQNRFTIVRIKPGYMGLCQRIGAQRDIVRLLPGRYVLNERMMRLIGTAQVCPNQNTEFSPHRDCWDSDIINLAKRYTLYYLQEGKRLFVSGRHGAFVLNPDKQERPFIFDAQAQEIPLNTSNPRDYHQISSDGNYHIVRLKRGERIVIRGRDGNDVICDHNEEHDALNTLDLSSRYYDYDGKVYSRNDKVVQAESITSVVLSPNDVLVVRDLEGHIRFLNQFDPSQPIEFRSPWHVIEVIAKTQNEYVYREAGFTVARVQATASQWPVIYDQESGEIKLMPPSLPYVFSSNEGQVYIGMVNKNEKAPQQFDVPNVGQVTVAVVQSGQLAMCRLNNISFFLSPSPEPYVFLPPNEFLGMVDNTASHVHVPGSDLHRIYVPAGQWAVAMIDGRQVILDPAASKKGGACQGNGIWIFRAQQLDMQGPALISEKCTDFFNVTRIQVPLNEIAFGVNSRTHEKEIWGPGNHVIDKSDGVVFNGFFQTQLDDVKIQDFEVVWKGGVSGKIEVNVGFHIDGIDDITTGANRNLDKIKHVLGRCQDHEELRQKVIENTKHHLLDVISRMEPLGYGSTMAGNSPELSSGARHIGTLRELENMFSAEVESIFEKYGIVVDNVTITKNEIDPKFVQMSESVQEAKMQARERVLVAEQDKERERIEQEKALQRQEAQTKQAAAKNEQRDIERQREIDDKAASARADSQAQAEQLKVAKAAELERQEMEASSQVRQQALKIETLQKKRQATELEMESRKFIAVKEAETKAVEETATAKASATARVEVARMNLEATKLEVEAQKLLAEADQVTGTAKMAVQQADKFGSLTNEQILQLRLAEVQANAGLNVAKALAVQGDGLDAVRQVGEAQGIRNLVQSSGTGLGLFSAMQPAQQMAAQPALFQQQ